MNKLVDILATTQFLFLPEELLFIFLCRFLTDFLERAQVKGKIKISH